MATNPTNDPGIGRRLAGVAGRVLRAWIRRLTEPPARRVFTDPHAVKVAKAVVKGDAATVARLLADGADPNSVGDQETSLLEWAYLTQQKAPFEALLQAGADPTHTDLNGRNMISHAVKTDYDTWWLQALLTHGIDPNTLDGKGDPPLVVAISTGDREKAQILLAAGADPNILGPATGTSVLHRAAVGHPATVLDLLKAGADPIVEDTLGFTFQSNLFSAPAACCSG